MDNSEIVRQMLLSLFKEISSNGDDISGKLFSDLVTSKKYKEGCLTISKTIANGSEANLRKQVENLLITNSKILEINERLIILLLIYVLGGSCSSDAMKAYMAIGGDSMEALKHMFNSKLQGRS